MKDLFCNDLEELTYKECLTINGGTADPGDFLYYIAFGFGWAYTQIKEAIKSGAVVLGNAIEKANDGMQQAWIECPVSVHEWN